MSTDIPPTPSQAELWPRIHPPWSDDQVEALNAYQASGRFHPFTCGGEHANERYSPDLVATTDGWVCPQRCGYTQDWAHAAMAEPSPPWRLIWPPT